MFRGILTLGAALAMVAGLTVAPAMADTEGHASQHVYVIVDSNITIGGLAADDNGGSNGGGAGNGGMLGYVDLGRVQTGMFCGWLRWRIDANTEAVKFCLAASDLWKGDDPIDATVLPIELYKDAGAEFEIEFGNTVGIQSPTQLFTTQMFIGDFPAWQTDYVTFESSQDGHFSQYLTTHVCWYQDDAEKPQGQYSGVVQLWGFIVPSL